VDEAGLRRRGVGSGSGGGRWPFPFARERVPTEEWPEIHAEAHRAIRQDSDGEKIAFGVSVVMASVKK